MEIAIEIPLDEGFIRRECPNCLRQFKWHSGPTDGRHDGVLDPPVYWCPYCAETAGPDEWWTPEQLEYARAAAAGPALQHIVDELGDAFKSSSSGLVKFSVEKNPDLPEPPAALHEPNDMVIVEPPCHPFEPLKVEESWRLPLHCLFCGSAFAVA